MGFRTRRRTTVFLTGSHLIGGKDIAPAEPAADRSARICALCGSDDVLSGAAVDSPRSVGKYWNSERFFLVLAIS